MMLKETDPQKLDRLASAQTRLAEQERIMSGRPLPGSRRPGKEARQQGYVPLRPADVAPEPVPLSEFVVPEG